VDECKPLHLGRIRVSLVDISAEMELFTPPQFLHQMELGRGLHSLTSELNLTTFGTHRSH
jgi:hypothetical protein